MVLKGEQESVLLLEMFRVINDDAFLESNL